MFCKNCGQEITSESSFCKNCGQEATIKFAKKRNHFLGWLKLYKKTIFIILGIVIVIFILNSFDDESTFDILMSLSFMSFIIVLTFCFIY